MTDRYGHFAHFNTVFGAPPDEPLRLVGGTYIIHTDQQRQEGHMWLTFLTTEGTPAKEAALRQTRAGQLMLKLGSPYRAASGWLALAERLDGKGHPPFGERGKAFVALFRQVGGDAAYRDFFRLELNP